ncbi:patatin-like phospholipase family protein [Parabacteroides sp. AM08-6]|uniref:patatin-like phospholipase family protein n=1 Tax=Parabacteroides sp. AM08-6 TaxID=2292053 RepID=UPI000EFE78F0|nr:patatin-like phospholipase family protein [Parabacteroides sp. AM08-6]RHJ78684.1 patatin [Parabacteroides sp. AM08-6]
MKKFLCFLLTLLMVLPSMAQSRKKVAVVLGGGGAKGVAHIGVLKVLEEAGIPIDIVTGTSMGAIVGGLYAIGYTPDEIEDMVEKQDWDMLLSDRVKRSSQFFPEKENSERYILSLPFGMAKKDRVIEGMIKGQNLQNLFSNLTIGYHDSVDFSTFLKPFACVAVDMVTGKDYVFHQGSLPLAMRASMAIPAVFAPVRLDSMVLVDGGLNNNYPVDVALEMGADIIIGVDLATSDLRELERLHSPGDVVTQIIALHGYDKYARNKEHTDLLFRPDMEPYRSASFSHEALDTLIHRGEREARNRWDEIIALKKKIGIPDDYRPEIAEKKGEPHLIQPADSFYIRNISFIGVDPRDEKWLLKASGLKENSLTTVEGLQKAMSIVVGTNAYSNVNYKLTGEQQQDLILTVQPKSVSSVNLGLRFDSEEIIGVLLNATFDYRKHNHSRLAFTGRVGAKTSFARLDCAIERSPLRNINLAYQFTYQDLDIFQKGEKKYNTTYRHHFAEFGYSDMNWMSFKLNVGLRYEYFDYNTFLYTGASEQYQVKPEGFVSYFATAHLETFDRRYFPNKGVSLQADYSMYTDNFVKYRGSSPFSAVSVNFKTVVPLTSHLSLLPALYGRVLIGNNPAYPFLNMVGGETFGRYLSQQIPFAGINHVEIFDNSVAVARLQVRQRIAGRNYISLTGNYAIHNNDFFRLFEGKNVWGGSLGYAYNSIAGPLSATFSMSNQNTHLQFYLNLGFNF